MECPPLSSRTLIADLLAFSPLTARALLDLRIDCTGCSMNKFCTIEEICVQYGLDMDVVMKKLEKYLARKASVGGLSVENKTL